MTSFIEFLLNYIIQGILAVLETCHLWFTWIKVRIVVAVVQLWIILLTIVKAILALLKACHSWLAKHKASLSTALVILATISLLFNTSAQSQKSEEETNLMYQLSNVGISYGGYTANTAEIVLDRSILENCAAGMENDPVLKGACGSNKVRLQEAALQRDSLIANNSAWIDIATTTIKKFNTDAPSLDSQILYTQVAALILLILAIIVNAL